MFAKRKDTAQDLSRENNQKLKQFEREFLSKPVPSQESR